MPRKIDSSLVGKKFSSLEVLSFEYMKNRGAYFLCKCDCGVLCIKLGTTIKSNTTKSCGCVGKETQRVAVTKHGGSKGKLFFCLQAIKRRCFNAKNRSYRRYGGRGISVCDDWLVYENFESWALSNGYKEGLSIDRINNDGNYEPGNCRWTTSKVQGNNKESCVYLTYNGEKLTIAQWAEKTNISWSTIKRRLKSGWPVNDILTTRTTHETSSLNYKGEIFPLHILAKRFGIKRETLWARINVSKMPVEEALTYNVKSLW